MLIEMRLNELFEESGLKKKYASKHLGVDVTTMSNWITGKSFPKLNQAVGLADFFGVNVEDLYVRKSNK